MADKERRRKRRQVLPDLEAVGVREGTFTSTFRVVDISETGAKLEVLSGEAPDEFTLAMSRRGGPVRKCRTVWRVNNQVGVRFGE